MMGQDCLQSCPKSFTKSGFNVAWVGVNLAKVWPDLRFSWRQLRLELIYSNTQVIEKKIKKIAGPAGPGRVRSPAQITTDPQFLQFLGGVQGGDMGLWGGSWAGTEPRQTYSQGIGTIIASTWVNLLPTCSQQGPNMSQHGVNVGPTWPQVEPTWSQLGSTWAQISSSKPTWANLEPTWGNLEAQKPLRATKKCKMQTDP